MSSRKVEPVSFNLDDPFEVRLHAWAKRHSFSPYIKRLIQRDMEGGQPVIDEIAPPGTTEGRALTEKINRRLQEDEERRRNPPPPNLPQPYPGDPGEPKIDIPEKLPPTVRKPPEGEPDPEGFI